MISLPPVPLFPTLESLAARNLLSNPGFEYGQLHWSVDGPDAAGHSGFDLLCTEGRFCFQVLPPATGETFVSQEAPVKPRTFYSFTAFLFAPDASEVALEVRDTAGNTLLGGSALSGP